VKYVLMFCIRGYQRFVSPLFGMNCRYEPTCSQYAIEAIGRHGAMRGSWLAVRRLARCRPGGGRGFDPVPDREAAKAAGRAAR